MVIGSYNHSRERGRELRERDHKEGGEPSRSEEDNHRPQLPHALCERSATTSQGSSLDLKYCISRHLLFILAFSKYLLSPFLGPGTFLGARSRKCLLPSWDFISV